jgi:hypothetical protein
LAGAVLTIASRNHGSWSLGGRSLCRFAGLDVVDVRALSAGGAAARAEPDEIQQLEIEF